MKLNRRRLFYLFLLLVTILVGLASRIHHPSIPQWVGLYLGDALWALMVYWIVSFLFSRSSRWRVAVYSLSFCFLIELSQLYQADWIHHLRSYRLGGLVLGHGFLWSDLLCYSVGIFTGTLIDNFIRSSSE